MRKMIRRPGVRNIQIRLTSKQVLRLKRVLTEHLINYK
jgi:hypothetical protein